MTYANDRFYFDSFAHGFFTSAYALDVQTRAGLAAVCWGFGRVASTLTSRQAVRVYRMVYHFTLAVYYTAVAAGDAIVAHYEAPEHDASIDESTATVLQADSLEVPDSDVHTAVTTASDNQPSEEPRDLSTMTIRELKAYAKDLHVPRYSRLNKSDLQDAIVLHLINIA